MLNRAGKIVDELALRPSLSLGQHVSRLMVGYGVGIVSFGRTPEKGQKASVTFQVTSLLVVQQRWASLQRAPVAGVPYLLALSKSSLNGVLGGQGNHL